MTSRLDYPGLVSVPGKPQLRGVVLEMASTPDWTRLTPLRRLWELMVAAGRLQVWLPLLRNARTRKMPERAVDESASVPRTSRGEQAQHIQDRRWSLLCDAARSGHETRSPESAEFAAQIVAWLALTRAGYGEVAPAGNIAQRFLAGDIETAPEGEMMAEICVLAHELAGPLERGVSTGDSPSTTKRRRPCDPRRSLLRNSITSTNAIPCKTFPAKTLAHFPPTPRKTLSPVQNARHNRPYQRI